MNLEVDRDDLRRTRLVDPGSSELPAGGARLRVERFGLSSNNVTYAAFGDLLKYWDFFPASPAGSEPGRWGCVPVWGYATVVESDNPELSVEQRVFGFLPMSGELVVQPGRVDGRGFRDLAAHRQAMASAYNRYGFTEADPVYRHDREAHQMVLWPLFFTSFLVDDFLGDNACFDASRVVISSASAKTSIGTAFLLAARPGTRVVGLTSPANSEFVASLGCYHETLTYPEASSLEIAPSVFVDIAGDPAVRAEVHGRLGDALHYSMTVGSTHWDHPPDPGEALAGPQPQFFFAPAQISKRAGDWGQDELDRRVADAWDRYATFCDGWIHFEEVHGPDAVDEVYRTLVSGRVDPALGYVCSMVPR